MFITLVCIAVALFGRPLVQSWNNDGHAEWKRASPFTDVQINGDDVVVEFNQQSYGLVSINEAATEEILRAAKHHFGFSGRKRFVEDLPQVLIRMGMPDEDTVDLVLKDAKGQLVYAAEAPMTAKNRSLIYQNRGNQGAWTSTKIVIGVCVLILLFSIGKDVQKLLTRRKQRGTTNV